MLTLCLRVLADRDHRQVTACVDPSNSRAEMRPALSACNVGYVRIRRLSWCLQIFELRSLLHQAILVLLPSRRARLEIHTAHLRELMSKLRSHPLSGFADRSAVGIAGRNWVGDGAGLGWSSTVSLAI